MTAVDPRLVVLAALLHQGRTLHVVTAVLTLGAWAFAGGVPALAAAAGLVLLVETWLAVRVGLDASLFDAMAAGTDPAVVDQGLVGLALVRATPERNLASRIAGARRLWRAQVGLTVLQGLLCAGAWLWWRL